MSEYQRVNILEMLRRRQLGLPVKEKGRSVRNCRNNYRCDFELLKTLLCDPELYLEVIACRKVSRTKDPSFCHNRLFTNNYCSWFNLCTSPTAGPSLMKSNIFSEETQQSSTQRPPPSSVPKIVDAVTVNPPNGCMPLPNSQHLPCILLLGKNGWLYQYNLKDASLLNKIFIPSNIFSDELIDPSNFTGQRTVSGLSESRDISSLKFTYKYITPNGAEGRVLVRSSTVIRNGFAYVANLLLALFPLRVISHFVTKAVNSNLKAELWTDIFVLAAVKGSSVSLYAFKDIENLYHLKSTHVQIGKKLFYRQSYDHNKMVEVGDTDIGIPYTTKLIDLEEFVKWSTLELFKTKVLRHIFRVGGVPYHYVVPTDKSCTSWSLRSLIDKKEIAKFHVDEKSDQSHFSGVDFHSDESGRLLLVNNNTVSAYKIEEVRNMKRHVACSQSKLSKTSPTQLITTSPISEPDFQLRVIGSPCKFTKEKVSKKSASKYKTVKCFEINVPVERPLTNSPEVNKWIYPSELPVPNSDTGHSSRGRTLRQTRRFVGNNTNDSDLGIRGVSYEDELDVLAVLHFQNPAREQYYGFGDKHYDLVVSLYDNTTGARMNTITLETDLIPSDMYDASIILEEDTVIYTRTELNNILNYKIMRFCRKY